jgi:hypothetical protein
MRAFVGVALGVVAMVSAPTVVHGQGGTITVWSDADYRGQSATLRGPTPDLRAYGLNNAISSLRIASGQWEVCEQPNFQGRCQVLSATSVRDLGKTTGWNDRISSLRPVRTGMSGGNVGGPPPGGYAPGSPVNGPTYRPGAPAPVRQLTLYSDVNFRGSAFPVNGPMAQAGTNTIRSVRAQGRWQVCDGRKYTGTCQIVSGDVPDVRRVGLSRIQSARPQ